MATESPFIKDGSQTTAATDLSAKQFYIVKVTGSRQVNICTANTDVAYGILQNKPKSGDAADVAVFGVVKVLCNGSSGITAGARFMPNTDGTAIAWDTNTHTAVGIALETVAANQVFTAFVGRLGVSG